MLSDVQLREVDCITELLTPRTPDYFKVTGSLKWAKFDNDFRKKKYGVI